jgi:ribosomal protein S3
MGQKIIPISLRLNKNENWHSTWVAEKNEYSNLLHFDLEIRRYFEYILNRKQFKIIKLHVVNISKNIHIFVYIQKPPSVSYEIRLPHLLHHLNAYYPHHHIKLYIKRVPIKNVESLKKNIGRIYYWIKKKNYNRINSDISKMIFNFGYALHTTNISMMTHLMKQNLEKRKSHKRVFNLINRTLQEFFKMFSTFEGYRLQFKGRLNGSKRKKKVVYQQGRMPLNTFKHDIKYHLNEFKTPSGICSIKLWIFLIKK